MGITKLVALVMNASSASRRDLIENFFSSNLNLFFFKIDINLCLVHPFKILKLSGCVIHLFFFIIQILEELPSVIIFLLSNNTASCDLFSFA